MYNIPCLLGDEIFFWIEFYPKLRDQKMTISKDFNF
nr:hypothetical protein CP0010 [imported] - Chlamydophila pneumoniae (strain AR39) [Chlamydia pneumoniae]